MDCDAPARRAAVLTVGTELVEGLGTDSNGPELSRQLAAAGFTPSVRETLPDDVSVLASRISAHLDAADLVVVTGGLGPTHDDITRQAAAHALGVPLIRDDRCAAALQPVRARHSSPEAQEQVMRQALVLSGAQVLMPGIGTAPGQLVQTARGHLLLLPGPPREMRPMFAEALAYIHPTDTPAVRTVRCARVPESDAQVTALSVLSDHPGIELTVLAKPSLVDIVLLPRGASAEELDVAAQAVARAIGPACYSTDGSTLAETVIAHAAGAHVRIALAESCTGGLVAAELTAVPGASQTLCGGVVTYSDAMKMDLLGVREATLRDHGAVSAEVAAEMADGVRTRAGADVAISITGIAGPGGGSEEKPVGTVWFGCASTKGTSTELHRFTGDREIVRARATVTALDLLRHASAGHASSPES